MNKCHVPITWVNDQTPAINDTHLNQYDGELDTLDDRVITLDTTKANQSDLLTCVASVTLNTTTGIMTITLKNGSATTFDTGLAKLAVNFDYDEDPTSPHYQQLILEMKDGTFKYIDLSALITQFEFDNTSTIGFSVDADGHVKANVLDGSITSSKLDPTFAVTIADAEANGLKSEGYANGTQNGTPVTSGSPYYENNAKYWKEQAQAIAGQTLGGLTDVTITTPSDGDALVYDANSGEWVNGASVSSASDISYDNTSSGLAATDVQDAVDEVNGAMQYLYNNTGGKNQLVYPFYDTTKSLNGLIFTDNGDGTVTVSGTASANTNFVYADVPQNRRLANNKTYILNGCPSGGGESTYQVYFCYQTTSGTYSEYYRDYGSGVEIPYSYSSGGVYFGAIRIMSGTIIPANNPITFSPMIRDASISDDTYVPYAMTNRELTERTPVIEYTGSWSTNKQFFTDVMTNAVNYIMNRGESFFLIGGLATNRFYYSGVGYGIADSTGQYVQIITSNYEYMYVISNNNGTITVRQFSGTIL